MAGYIKLTDIEGESTDKNHEKWINILSISQSIMRPISIGAAGSTTKGSVSCGEISVVKEVDKSTPKLIGAVCKGTKFAEVTIDLTTDTGAGERLTYLQWKLKNAYVSAYNVGGGASGGSVPTESLGITYESIDWIYNVIDEKGKSQGKVEQGWNVGKGAEK